MASKGALTFPFDKCVTELGQGYDSVNREAKGTVVEFPSAEQVSFTELKNEVTSSYTSSIPSPQTAVSFSLKFVENTSELRDALDASGSVSITKGVVSGSVSGAFSKKRITDGSKVYVVVKISVTHSVYSIDPRRGFIDPAMIPGKPGSSMNASDFVQAFGDHFVQSVIVGGEMAALLEITKNKNETSQDIKADGNISVKSALSVTGEAQFQMTVAKLTSRRKTEITATCVGGNVRATPTTTMDLIRLARRFPLMVLGGKGRFVIGASPDGEGDIVPVSYRAGQSETYGKLGDENVSREDIVLREVFEEVEFDGNAVPVRMVTVPYSVMPTWSTVTKLQDELAGYVIDDAIQIFEEYDSAKNKILSLTSNFRDLHLLEYDIVSLVSLERTLRRKQVEILGILDPSTEVAEPGGDSPAQPPIPTEEGEEATAPAEGGEEATVPAEEGEEEAAPTTEQGETAAAPVEEGEAAAVLAEEGVGVEEAAVPAEETEEEAPREGEEAAAPAEEGEDAAAPAEEGGGEGAAPVEEGAEEGAAPVEEGAEGAPPAEEGGEGAPPTEEGEEEVPPAEEGEEEVPPTEEGEEEIPPAEEGEEEVPPAEEGEEEVPPAEEGEEAAAQGEDGAEEVAPAEEGAEEGEVVPADEEEEPGEQFDDSEGIVPGTGAGSGADDEPGGIVVEAEPLIATGIFRAEFAAEKLSTILPAAYYLVQADAVVKAAQTRFEEAEKERMKAEKKRLRDLTRAKLSQSPDQVLKLGDDFILVSKDVVRITNLEKLPLSSFSPIVFVEQPKTFETALKAGREEGIEGTDTEVVSQYSKLFAVATRRAAVENPRTFTETGIELARGKLQLSVHVKPVTVTADGRSTSIQTVLLSLVDVDGSHVGLIRAMWPYRDGGVLLLDSISEEDAVINSADKSYCFRFVEQPVSKYIDGEAIEYKAAEDEAPEDIEHSATADASGAAGPSSQAVEEQRFSKAVRIVCADSDFEVTVREDPTTSSRFLALSVPTASDRPKASDEFINNTFVITRSID